MREIQRVLEDIDKEIMLRKIDRELGAYIDKQIREEYGTR